MENKFEYGFGPETLEFLRVMAGKKLVSYLLTDNVEVRPHSFETFVLRFEDEDVEVTTKEVVGIAPWFDETNTVEVFRRPNRDTRSPVGKWVMCRQEDGSVKREKREPFYEFPVGRIVDGVSVATAKLSYDANASEYGGESGSGEYVRAVVLHFGDDALVFDKGAQNWSDIWDVSWRKAGDISFPIDDCPEEYPEINTTIRVEKLSAVAGKEVAHGA